MKTDEISVAAEPAIATPDPNGGRIAGVRSGLGRATSIMVGLTLIGSAMNYASNIVFSHLLTTGSYGSLTALLAFVTIVAVPTGASQTVIAERVTLMLSRGEQGQARYLIRHAGAHVLVIATIVTVVYCACIPLVKKLLGLEAVGPAIALAPLMFVTFLIPVAYGVLQGMERFVALGVALLGVAFGRLLVGVPWTLLAGGGAGGPLLGQALGSFLVLVLVAWLVRDHLIGSGSGAARTGLRRVPNTRALVAGGAFIAFALLSNLDVVLARLFLSPSASGEYAALVTIEKLVIFLPAAVAVVMVPRATRAHHGEGSAAAVLRTAALLVAFTTLVVAIPAALLPELVIKTMFGAKYVGAAGGVLPIVIAGTGLALIYLLVVYTVAIQDRRWIWLLAAGVGAQVVGITIFHASPIEIAIVQASVIATLLVANELAFHPMLRAERLIAVRRTRPS